MTVYLCFFSFNFWYDRVGMPVPTSLSNKSGCQWQEESKKDENWFQEHQASKCVSLQDRYEKMILTSTGFQRFSLLHSRTWYLFFVSCSCFRAVLEFPTLSSYGFPLHWLKYALTGEEKAFCSKRGQLKPEENHVLLNISNVTHKLWH